MTNIQSRLRVIPDLDSMEYLTTHLQSHRFPVHFHDTFVIQLVNQGTDWCCVNGLTARQGEVFVHFPFASHSGGTDSAQALQYQAIYPSKGLFSDLTGLDDSAISTGSFKSNGAELVRVTRSLFAAIESGHSAKRLLNPLQRVFAALLIEYRAIESTPKPSDQNLKLDAARTYLVDHVDDDVTIEELSNRCGLSPFHLVRAFKNKFGITPRRFLISQRVSFAKQLMISGTPVAMAASTAGFSDQSHLNRCFKRVTALSPGQFRSAAVSQSKLN